MNTALEYIAHGLARSASARPDLLVTAGGELLQELNSILAQLSVDVGYLNPDFLLATATRGFLAGSPGGWLAPADCLRVRKVFADATTTAVPALAVGAEIFLVDPKDRLNNPYQPCVVDAGNQLIPTGLANASHPSAGTIVLEYTRSFATFVALGATMDARFPHEHDGLIAVRLAQYLALKDRRLDDLAEFKTEETDVHLPRWRAYLDQRTLLTQTRLQRSRGDQLTATPS